MENKKTLFWDFDNTLGNFEDLIYDVHSKTKELILSEKSDKKEIGECLTQRIKETLTYFKNKEYLQVITSFSLKTYIKEILKLTKIEQFFKEIFDATSLLNYEEFDQSKILKKDYLKSLQYCNISQEDAKKNLLIIGDSHYDCPVLNPGIVFIYNTLGSKIDSTILKELINNLDIRGQGDFSKGFKHFQKTGEKEKISLIFELDPITKIEHQTRKYEKYDFCFYFFKSKIEETPIILIKNRETKIN